MDAEIAFEPVWAEWRGRVATAGDLAACVETLGLLPLRAPAGWPALPAVLAPGVTTATAWAWAGALVDRRDLFAGRVLPGLAAPCLAAIGVFALAFARTPGSDPGRAYSQGAFGITAKAVVDLLWVRGPLAVQQVRLGLGQHKRFLIHDAPQAMEELERALVVVPVGPEYSEQSQSATLAPRATNESKTQNPKPKIQNSARRFIPPPNPEIDLRAWELTVRWAPPALLAAADRLREQPGQARTLLRTHLAALNPQAPATEIDTLLGEDGAP